MNESLQNEEFKELETYPMERELKRIESLLAAFVDENKTRELMNEISDWAVEIDETIDEIKEIPAMDSQFLYDGHAFVPKSPGLEATYPIENGLSFLQSIDENMMRPYFSGSKYDITGFMNLLYTKYVSSAKQMLRDLR